MRNRPNRKSIGIIICYYGEWPWYFEYFLHSCKFNPSVDFLIITDQKYDRLMPSNVKIFYRTLDELNEMSSSVLGFRVNIMTSYKLCDFKPVFGLLFSDLLNAYDFWGQSDIDVIYGNIRKFVTDRMLEKYDFINVRHDYTTGCFYLFRNNDFLNNIFKKSKDFKKVLSESKHYCFDECNFAHNQLTNGKSIFEARTEIESFTHVIMRAVDRKELNAYLDFILIEGVPGRIRFDRGKIIYKNKFEAILYHLIGLKKVYNPNRRRRPLPDTYYISPAKVYFKK